MKLEVVGVPISIIFSSSYNTYTVQCLNRSVVCQVIHGTDEVVFRVRVFFGVKLGCAHFCNFFHVLTYSSDTVHVCA